MIHRDPEDVKVTCHLVSYLKSISSKWVICLHTKFGFFAYHVTEMFIFIPNELFT